MKELLEAIKNKDLVKAKKVFAESMKEKQDALKEATKIELAQSVVIEGEEPEDKTKKDPDDNPDNDDGKQTDDPDNKQDDGKKSKE